MKLVCIAVLISICQLKASVVAQNVRIDISLENVRLEKVFSEIQEKTGYRFMYNHDPVSKVKVNVNFTKTTVKNILDNVFKDLPLGYKFVKDLIIVYEKDKRLDQNIVKVTGKVVDENGNPMPGVTVFVKGTTVGTATDSKGDFVIEMAKIPGLTLVFSFVGMETKTVKVGSKKEIKVVMKESTTALEGVNVVSIGYGVQKREKIAGAITSITSKELNDMPVPNFATLLQGKIPGVAVNNWSGEPGVRNEVYVRGVGVVGNDRNSRPLYVIDGIPIEPMEDKTMLNRSTGTDPLAGINPNDIESVDILKDASAASIYGSRGANGVIIVKTKRGLKDRPRVNYSSNYSINMVPQLQETMGGIKERDLKRRLWSMYGGESDMDISLTDSLNPFYNNSTNWQDLYYRTSVSHDHNLSISGGNKGMTYRVSFGYRKDEGILVSSDFERYSVNSSTKYNPLKDFYIDFNLQMSRTDRSRPNGDNNALSSSTGIGMGYPSSLIPSTNSQSMKALQDAYELMSTENINDNIIPSLTFDLTLFRHLRLRSMFSINYNKSERSTFRPSALNGIDYRTGKLNGPSYNASIGSRQSYSTENTIGYLNTFNDAHTLDVIAGYSQSLNEYKNLYANASKGVSDAITDLNGYTSENTNTSSRFASNGMRSFFGRLQYDYKSKYIVSCSFRADGSSRFGENNKYGYFPSVSMAYNLHREGFMEKFQWLNICKLRWSWGINGNQFGNDFLAQGLYNVSRLGQFYGNDSDYPVNTYNGEAIVMPSYSSGIANPDLTWEEAEQYDMGLDLSFFNYRLIANFDAYWKKTSGILFDFNLPAVSGYKKVYKNATEVINYGYEFNLIGQILNPSSDFTWRMSLNGGITKNYVSKLPNNNADILKNTYSGIQVLRVGRPANGYFTYMSDGIYSTDADVPVNPYTGKKLNMSQKEFEAGDYIIKDLDGSGHIYEVYSTGGGLTTSDRSFAGNPYPKITGGWNNTFRYKNFTLDMNFFYSIGRKVLNLTIPQKMSQILQNPTSNMYDYTQYNHWEKPGDIAEYPILSPDRFKEKGHLYNYKNVVLNTFIEDASFLRLTNVRFSYSFNRDKIRKYKLRNLSIYAQLTNVFTITSYSGADPQNINMFGRDEGNNYALPRVCNIGLNVEF